MASENRPSQKEIHRTTTLSVLWIGVLSKNPVNLEHAYVLPSECIIETFKTVKMPFSWGFCCIDRAHKRVSNAETGEAVGVGLGIPKIKCH